VVHRNVGNVCDDLYRGQSLDQLVTFLPAQGWLSNSIAATYDVHLSDISAVQAKSFKLVFGPHIQRGDYNRSPSSALAQTRLLHPHWRISGVIRIIRTVSDGRRDLTVYGLERVKVSRSRQYPYFTDWESAWGNKWLNRRHAKKTYGPHELLETVLHHVNGRYDEVVGHNRLAPRPSICFKTIEEYTATQCDAELFPCELQLESSTKGKWLSSKYWESKILWQKSSAISELGEEDDYESDTDEEHPVLKRPKPLSNIDWESVSAKRRRNRRANERKLQKLKENSAAALAS
jgi:hypothetical protein